jgi:chitinase
MLKFDASAAVAASGHLLPAIPGMVINIINGGLECGKGAPSDKETTRFNYYNRMASALGVSPDPNTSCASMRPYS